MNYLQYDGSTDGASTATAYIYCLQFANGKKYIGSTVDIQRRMVQHYRGAMRASDGELSPLQDAIKNYGMPVVQVVEECTIYNRFDREGCHIKEQKTMVPDGYNQVGGAKQEPPEPDAPACKHCGVRGVCKACRDFEQRDFIDGVEIVMRRCQAKICWTPYVKKSKPRRIPQLPKGITGEPGGYTVEFEYRGRQFSEVCRSKTLEGAVRFRNNEYVLFLGYWDRKDERRGAPSTICFIPQSISDVYSADRMVLPYPLDTKTDDYFGDQFNNWIAPRWAGLLQWDKRALTFWFDFTLSYQDRKCETRYCKYNIHGYKQAVDLCMRTIFLHNKKYWLDEETYYHIGNDTVTVYDNRRTDFPLVEWDKPGWRGVPKAVRYAG